MTDAQIYPLRLGSKLGDTVVEGGGANWNQLDVDEIYKNDPAVAGWLGYDELSDGSGIKLPLAELNVQQCTKAVVAFSLKILTT
jgi:hypothetical protein